MYHRLTLAYSYESGLVLHGTLYAARRQEPSGQSYYGGQEGDSLTHSVAGSAEMGFKDLGRRRRGVRFGKGWQDKQSSS